MRGDGVWQSAGGAMGVLGVRWSAGGAMGWRWTAGGAMGCWGASAAWTGRADRSRGVAGLLGPTEGPPEGPRSVWQERCACMSSQGQWYESQVISRCGYAAQFDLSQHVNMTHLWKMARVSESMKTSVPSKPTQHATPLGQCLSTNHAHPKDPEWQP